MRQKGYTVETPKEMYIRNSMRDNIRQLAREVASGDPVLYDVAEYGSPQMLDFVYKETMEIYYKGSEEEALMKAAFMGQMDNVKYLVEERGANTRYILTAIEGLEPDDENIRELAEIGLNNTNPEKDSEILLSKHILYQYVFYCPTKGPNSGQHWRIISKFFFCHMSTL